MSPRFLRGGGRGPPVKKHIVFFNAKSYYRSLYNYALGKRETVIQKKKRWFFYPLSAAVGLLNGLFGAGGGVVAVPLLRSAGAEADKAHATSISITFPLALLSGYFYLQGEHFTLADALPYVPGAVIGALVGAWLLPRIKTMWLRRIFGAVVVFSAVRLLMR